MAPFQYSPDGEARPDEPFYDVEFQSSLTSAQELATNVRNRLQDCEVTLPVGSSLHKLLEESNRLSHFQRPIERIIGLVGNSGEGKLHFTRVKVWHDKLGQ